MLHFHSLRAINNNYTECCLPSTHNYTMYNDANDHVSAVQARLFYYCKRWLIKLGQYGMCS